MTDLERAALAFWSGVAESIAPVSERWSGMFRAAEPDGADAVQGVCERVAAEAATLYTIASQACERAGMDEERWEQIFETADRAVVLERVENASEDGVEVSLVKKKGSPS